MQKLVLDHQYDFVLLYVNILEWQQFFMLPKVLEEPNDT